MEDENKITSKIAMPSAAKIIKEKKLDISDIASTGVNNSCLLYTSPSPRDATLSRMPSSA